MDRLDAIIASVEAYFETKNDAREQALRQSREMIKFCANSIRATHRGEFDTAEELLSQAQAIAEQMESGLAAHPDLYHAGYTQDALKELAEARITYALVTDEPLPSPEELGILPAAYINGLAEAMGEMRRYLLDTIRRGNVSRSEAMLDTMEHVYTYLVAIDYPAAITAGLRHTTDMVRGVLERTRGDLTTAVRQEALQEALQSVEEQFLSRLSDLAKD